MRTALRLTRVFFDSDNLPPAPPESKPPVPGTQPNSDASKTLTQEQVNAIVAEEKRKHAESLKKIQEQASTTAAEKAQLAAKIKELESTYMTEQERATAAAQQERQKLEGRVKELETDTGNWRNRFAQAVFENQTATAAATQGAFNPGLVVEILKPRMKLVEVLDKDGRGTGHFEPRVPFKLKNKDGNLVDVELSPKDAVEQLAKTPEEYGSLFRSTSKGGQGSSSMGSGGAGATLADVAKQISSNGLSDSVRDALKKELGK